MISLNNLRGADKIIKRPLTFIHYGHSKQIKQHESNQAE